MKITPRDVTGAAAQVAEWSDRLEKARARKARAQLALTAATEQEAEADLGVHYSLSELAELTDALMDQHGAA